jgi:hypothetical protein
MTPIRGYSLDHIQKVMTAARATAREEVGGHPATRNLAQPGGRRARHGPDPAPRMAQGVGIVALVGDEVAGVIVQILGTSFA